MSDLIPLIGKIVDIKGKIISVETSESRKVFECTTQFSYKNIEVGDIFYGRVKQTSETEVELRGKAIFLLSEKEEDILPFFNAIFHNAPRAKDFYRKLFISTGSASRLMCYLHDESFTWWERSSGILNLSYKSTIGLLKEWKIKKLFRQFRLLGIEDSEIYDYLKYSLQKPSQMIKDLLENPGYVFTVETDTLRPIANLMQGDIDPGLHKFCRNVYLSYLNGFFCVPREGLTDNQKLV